MLRKQRTSNGFSRTSFQGILEKELERLKRTLKFGYELKVIWIPNGSSSLSGEVKGETIYVYDDKKALETLRHEFLDYAVSQAIEPYSQVTNKLVQLVNELAYRRKERLVEVLSNLLDPKCQNDFVNRRKNRRNLLIF